MAKSINRYISELLEAYQEVTQSTCTEMALDFHVTLSNLYLDTTNCGPIVERPDDWPAIYKTGNETPKMILSNNGTATIEVQNHSISSK